MFGVCGSGLKTNRLLPACEVLRDATPELQAATSSTVMLFGVLGVWGFGGLGV